MFEPKVVYEDETLFIVNKPSGWIVNEASTTGDTPVVQTWIKKHYDFETAKDDKLRSGIVHRIDKETSGILIVSKTASGFTNIQKQFKQRKVKKSYLALLHGILEVEKGTVKAPVGRLPWNRERFGVLPGGRSAETNYSLIKSYKKDKQEYCLVEFKPITGRTHQIRIHSKYLHHPIVSDDFYAGRKTARDDRNWCPRLFLHAWKIGFQHPREKEQVNFQADLHDDLKKCLESLEIISETK